MALEVGCDLKSEWLETARIEIFGLSRIRRADGCRIRTVLVVLRLIMVMEGFRIVDGSRSLGYIPSKYFTCFLKTLHLNGFHSTGDVSREIDFHVSRKFGIILVANTSRPLPTWIGKCDTDFSPI